MFGSDVLEVGLGLTLFFLLASLMATAIRELIEALIKTRAMDLERGVRELLDDPRGVAMAQSFFDHAHIFSLFRGGYDATKLKSASIWARWLPTTHPWVKDKPGFEMRWWARRSLPTYIPSGQFATAVIDLVARGSGSWPYPVSSEPLTLDLLRQRAAALPSPRLQRAVLSAVDHAAGDMAKVKTNLEDWFNGSMDRVSGAYKRRTQAWLVLIGLAIAVLFNLDALTVTQRLIEDPALRKAAVAHAEKLAAKEAAKSEPATDTLKPQEPAPQAGAGKPAQAPAVGASKTDGTKADQAKTDASDPGDAGAASAKKSVIDDFKKSSETVESLKNDLVNLGYPIGWRYVALERGHDKDDWKQAALGDEAKEVAKAAKRQRMVIAVPAPQTCQNLTKAGACNGARRLKFTDWAGIVLGWLMTAVAISLGAPFWFDMLNKIMVIRSTVKPREKSRDEGSEDRRPARSDKDDDSGGGGAAAPKAKGAVPPAPAPGVPAPAAPMPAAEPPPVPGFEPETWGPNFKNEGELL